MSGIKTVVRLHDEYYTAMKSYLSFLLKIPPIFSEIYLIIQFVFIFPVKISLFSNTDTFVKFTFNIWKKYILVFHFWTYNIIK